MKKRILSLALALALCLGLTVPALAADYTEVVPCKYDDVRNFSEGLAAVCVGDPYDGGKWGFIDKTGKEVIPCKYDDVRNFSEGLAAVYIGANEFGLGGKWGYIDKTGKEVVPCKYSAAMDFSEGLAAVRVDETDKWGFIDKTGREVIPCKYNYAYDFSDGLAVVYIGSKCGYIDKTGKEVIPCKYTYAGTFSEGLAAVRDENYKYGYIDKTGKEVLPFKYSDVGSFSEGLAMVRDEDWKCGFIDKTGKEVVPCKYDAVENFSEGLAAVNIGANEFGLGGKWGYIDKTGKEVVPLKYGSVESFSEGLAAVRDENYKWGYIDKTGKEVVPCKYDGVKSFSEGLAAVCVGNPDDDGKWGFIAVSGAGEQPATPVEPEQPAEVKTANPTNDKLEVNGAAQNPTVYKIGGSNYFKIRDVAAVLNGTEKQFAVGYAGGKVTVTSGQPYEMTGTELKGAPAASGSATPSNDSILIDGAEASLTVYKIGGSNYFKLRDLGKALNFYVGWEAGRGVYIETGKPYSE